MIGYIGRINERDLEAHRGVGAGRQLPRHRPHRQDRRRAELRAASCTAPPATSEVEVDAGGRAVRTLDAHRRRCPATTWC
ncbi:MAG: hypothetical protein MZW92_77400 [Comamonadaceae bacterium]|nr:hypothetical protein [Comamonadaceae bacterium]